MPSGMAELVREQHPELAGGASKPAGKWRATPTTVDGIRFRSATEARVYVRLRDGLGADEKLVCGARFLLVANAAKVGRASKAGSIEVDFTIWRAEGGAWVLSRAIDAKPGRSEAKSRDWRRGARAFAATYGREIEEAER